MEWAKLENKVARLQDREPVASRGVGYTGVRTERRQINELAHTAGAQSYETPKARQVADLSDSAHIALDVGLAVVAKRLPGFELLIVNSGIAAGVQDVVNVTACVRLTSFVQGERQQPKQCGAPGERLADGAGQRQMLASSKDEEAILAQFVSEHLQVGQERRNPLDLVQDSASDQLREEPLRVGFSEFPLVGQFEVDVFETRESRAAQCGLAGLARPRHGDEGVLREQLDQKGGDLSLDHGADHTANSSI